MVFGFASTGSSKNSSSASLATASVKADDPNALSLPIAHPLPGTSTPSRPVLTSEQQTKVDTIIKHLSSEGYAIPTELKDLKGYWKLKAKDLARNPHARRGTDASVMTLANEDGLEPLGEREKFWLTSEQIQRCLRATKWDLEKAIQRAEETLVWRREYGTDNLQGPDVEEEGRTGKQYCVGYDKQSRPCLYMHPYRQNTKVSPRQIQFVVWTLERAVDLMPPGVENLALCIDFGASQGGGQPTSLGQARQVLYILQTYYAERLGRAICVDVPGIFWAFYKLIQSFIDPVTKDKLRFVRDQDEARELVDPAQLIREDFGGDLNFAYKHDEYFPALEKLCKGRRDAQFERWTRLCDSQIGASEWVIKGGDDEQYRKEASLPKTPDMSNQDGFDDPRTPRATVPGQLDGFAFVQDGVTPSVDNQRVPFASPALSTYELAPLASAADVSSAKIDPEECATPARQQAVHPSSSTALQDITSQESVDAHPSDQGSASLPEPIPAPGSALGLQTAGLDESMQKVNLS